MPSNLCFVVEKRLRSAGFLGDAVAAHLARAEASSAFLAEQAPLEDIAARRP